MTLVIDTGEPDVLNTIPDWFRDLHPKGTETARVVHDYAYHMIGDMKTPAKLDTVRKHMLRNWPFLKELAAIHPDVFDEVMQSFAERSLTFG